MLHTSNIRMAYKIGSLGAVGILGLLLVGVIYFVGSETQTRYQTIAAAASAVEATTNKLLIQLLQSRRHEKDFLLRKDEQYVERHRRRPKPRAKDLISS